MSRVHTVDLWGILFNLKLLNYFLNAKKQYKIGVLNCCLLKKHPSLCRLNSKWLWPRQRRAASVISHPDESWTRVSFGLGLTPGSLIFLAHIKDPSTAFHPDVRIVCLWRKTSVSRSNTCALRADKYRTAWAPPRCCRPTPTHLCCSQLLSLCVFTCRWWAWTLIKGLSPEETLQVRAKVASLEALKGQRVDLGLQRAWEGNYLVSWWGGGGE